MPEYRRNRVPGGTFFTLNLLDRRSDLLVGHVEALREAVRRTRLRSPFRIDAWVVLPANAGRIPAVPDYRRNRVPGRAFFFTSTCAPHIGWLPTSRAAPGRVDTLEEVRRARVYLNVKKLDTLLFEIGESV
jgi:hypothetical protein